MQKTSTLKPFARGDIFLGNTYLNNPKDDHIGEGRVRQHSALPGCGSTRVAPKVDERYALADVWRGVVARIDLNDEKILQQMDTGFTAPFRSLAGIVMFRGRMPVPGRAPGVMRQAAILWPHRMRRQLIR